MRYGEERNPILSILRYGGVQSMSKEILDKLDARADKCLFVGYPRDSIGYLFYHPTE